MILCAGEALIDMLPGRTADGEAAFVPRPGGAALNSAIAVARLGVPAGLFTGLSRDPFGRQLEAVLAADGVDTALAPRSDRPTTLAFVVLEDGHATYAFHDENSAGRMLSGDDLPDAAALAGVDALLAGGISLAVEPCATAYAALFAREAGRRVTMLDPNIRPALVADEALYRARLETLLAAACIVKVSDEDLAWLFGPGDAGEQARALRARGPALVCVTEGARGVTAHHAGGHLHVPAPPARVVDTVGAGDTFNAGLLAGLRAAGALTPEALAAPDRAALAGALSLGVRAAAVTVARAGANPPRADEVP